MDSRKWHVEVFAGEKTIGPGFICSGSDAAGRCPLERPDGTIFCRGQFLRIHETPSQSDPLNRWIWTVDPHAQTCPLKSMGLSR